MAFGSVEEAIAWLDDHVDHETKMPSRRQLPTLDRMRELAGLLGDPQLAFPSVHVTGTNGKGSTAAMTTALLGAMGLTVGTYTSPSLSKVNERIARSGEPIDDASLGAVLETIALAERSMRERPTRFEILTAAGLSWFAEVAVDAAVVEVGVGGTWDATNVVDGEVAVITNISYDHTDILGPTLEGIARDKVGIVKPGSIAVIGEQDPALVSIMREVADEAGAAQVWVRGQEFGCRGNCLAVGGRLVDLWTPGGTYDELVVPFHGAHQGLNASCALAAAEAFFGTALDPSTVAQGLGAAKMAGRLEVVGRHPLCLLDGAHNVAGMQALACALGDFSVDGRTVAVVGMLTERDPSAMLAPLADAGVRSLVACPPASPRAQPAEVVAGAGTAAGMDATTAISVPDAVSRALDIAGIDGLVVVTGSLYLVAEARAHLLQTVSSVPPLAG